MPILLGRANIPYSTSSTNRISTDTDLKGFVYIYLRDPNKGFISLLYY